MPPVTPEEFKTVALEVLRKPHWRKDWQYTEKSQARKWASYFGITPEVASNVWNRLDVQNLIPPYGKPKHLLYGYVLLKKYAGDAASGDIVGCHYNTFNKWAWKFIPLIHGLHHQVIRFENRLNGWDKTKTNVATTVDCTTFGCYDKWPFDNEMWDPKRHKAGLKYEVAHSVHNSGHIVHWSGWHKGSKSDIKIFRGSLKAKLEAGECVEADAGCSGECCLKNPEAAKSRKAKKQKGKARARQECIFCKMKKFQCLRGIWIHSYDKHEQAVGAILVSIQIGLELGTVKLWPLGDYEVEYF